MSNNNLNKDWREVVESPSKIKFETKRSYQYCKSQEKVYT